MTDVIQTSGAWLALREPEDARARSAELAATAAAMLGRPPIVVHDLGSGTGSMMRWLAPLLPGPQTWVLHDWDASLLRQALDDGSPDDGSPDDGAVDDGTLDGGTLDDGTLDGGTLDGRIRRDRGRTGRTTLDGGADRRVLTDSSGRPVTVETRVGELADIGGGELVGASLVTASALLDVLTSEEVHAIAAACMAARVPTLLSLSVTGEVELTPRHPLDDDFRVAFNAHQRRSADGRRLLGPYAVAVTRGLFLQEGWHVRPVDTPWLLGPHEPRLLAEWFDGWVDAALEQNPGLLSDAADYRDLRAAQLRHGELLRDGAAQGSAGMAAMTNSRRQHGLSVAESSKSLPVGSHDSHAFRRSHASRGRRNLRAVVASPRVRTWAIRIAGVLVLAAVASRVGAAPFVHGLLSIDVRAIAAAAGLIAIATVASAWRWRVVAVRLGADISVHAAVGMYYRSQFFNTVLPGGVLGDVHRAVSHGRNAGDVAAASRAVVIERTAGQIVQAVITIVVLAWAGAEFEGSVLVGVAITLVLVVGAFGVAMVSPRVRGFVRREAAELRAGVGSRAAGAQVIAASVLVVGCHVATFAVAVTAVGGRVPPLRLAVLALVVLLAAGIPLNVGGWGPREGVAGWVFASAGLGASLGIAASTAFGILVAIAVAPGAVVAAVSAMRVHAHGGMKADRAVESDGSACRISATDIGARRSVSASSLVAHPRGESS